MSDELVEVPVVVHNYDCRCFCNLDGEPPRSFVCGHCDEEFGWCYGAADQVEEATGLELCDPCAIYFYQYKERTGQWPIQPNSADAVKFTG